MLATNLYNKNQLPPPIDTRQTSENNFAFQDKSQGTLMNIGQVKPTGGNKFLFHDSTKPNSKCRPESTRQNKHIYGNKFIAQNNKEIICFSKLVTYCFLKKQLLLLLFCVIVVFQSNATEHKINITHPFDQLMSQLNAGDQFYVELTAISIKNQGNKKESFTSHGKGPLQKASNAICQIKGVKMQFSDQSNFQGASTIEHFKISKKGNDIGVEIRFQSWGNRSIALREVSMSKEKQGYFISGKMTNGSNISYYNLAIYKKK